MSTYASISGIINAEHEVSVDLCEYINKGLLWDCQLHRTNEGDWMFHGTIKECRMDALWNALSKVSQMKTKDNVLDEWYNVDGNAIITYESDFEKGTWVRLNDGGVTTVNARNAEQGDSEGTPLRGAPDL